MIGLPYPKTENLRDSDIMVAHILLGDLSSELRLVTTDLLVADRLRWKEYGVEYARVETRLRDREFILPLGSLY